MRKPPLQGLPWPTEQDDIVRNNRLLTGRQLHVLVNAAGPTRSLTAVVTRRGTLGVLKCPEKRGSKAQLEAIAARHAQEARITVSAIKGPRRERQVFRARARAMAEAYDTGNFSYITIGLFFGGRDHSTAFNAVAKARALAQQEFA